MSRKPLIVVSIMLVLLSLLAAGCQSQAAVEEPAAEEPAVEEPAAEEPAEEEPAAEEPAAEEPAAEEPAADAEAITVAVVAGGEIGDKGFIDSANEGLQWLEEELGIQTLLLQGRDEPDRYLDLLLSAAEEADLVYVVPGYFFDEQLQEVVPQFPDTTFVYVDGMASIRYLENEGSFLAGALAAMMTTRTDVLTMADDATVIGQMGGADMPVIHNFMVGFEQGALYVNPDITVITRFAGTHFDPAKGRETALAMYEEGADIIFQVAGPTGLGVFEAAKEADRYVIGVDTNQKPLAPEYTIASMRKRVGESLIDFTQLYLAGEIEIGEAYLYGLAKNGVGIDYGEMDPDLVPQDVRDQIAELQQMIIDGEIVVEQYAE
jgi:basic membrane protein A